MPDGATFSRFAKKVRLGEGCWPWHRANSNGYGSFWLNGRTINAHRAAYQLMRGPISPGLTVDHLCRNRRCVNPGHLELVSRGENVLRGETIPAANLLKTHCQNGHPLTGSNLYARPRRIAGRDCRQCRRAAGRKHDLQRRNRVA